MWKDLALAPIFLLEVMLAFSLSSNTEPSASIFIMPFLVTVVYAAWNPRYTPAFIAGLISPWAFPTAVFLFYLLLNRVVINFPLEGFAFFSFIGLVYGLVGLLTVKMARRIGGSAL